MIGVESLKISHSVVRLIGDIDEFKGRWHGLSEMTTALTLLNDVKAHGENFNRILKPLSSHDFTSEMLIKLHGLGRKEPSSFRTDEEPLTVMNTENVPVGFLDTALPAEIPAFVEKLLEWVNEQIAEDKLHPLIVSGIFSGVFLQICPFKDGNLRILNMMNTLLMLRAGYAYAPFSSLDTAFRAQAGQWFRALKDLQVSIENGRPDWAGWLECYLKIIAAHKDNLAHRMSDKQGDLASLPPLSARIMALFDDHDTLQMKQIIKLTRGRRATIKLRLSELLDQGYLVRHGQGRSTYYSLVEA